MGGFFGGGTNTRVMPGNAMPLTDPAQANFSGAISPFAASNLGNQANLTNAGTQGLMYGANQAFGQLPDILRQGPGEAAYPQIAGDISTQIGQPLWDPYNAAAQTGLPLAGIQRELMTDRNDPDLNAAVSGLGAAGGDISSILSRLGSFGGDQDVNSIVSRLSSLPADQDLGNAITALGSSARGGGGNLGPPDTSASMQAIMGPMLDAFKGQVLPDIRSQALAAGAPGGNREFDITGMATQKFGSGMGAALAEHLAEMTNANANMFNANTNANRIEQEALASSGNLALQRGQLGQRTLESAGTLAQNRAGLGERALESAGQLGERAAESSGQLAMNRASLAQRGDEAAGQLGISGINQGGILAGILQGLGLTGPKAAMASDAQNRDLATQRTMLPMTLANQLMQGASGVRATMPQWNPLTYPGSTTIQQGTPGAQAGAAVSSIAGLIPFLQGLGIKPQDLPGNVMDWLGNLFGGGDTVGNVGGSLSDIIRTGPELLDFI
jgi:hypothetical protein